MADFNCGDVGVPFKVTPQNPIPPGSTNIQLVFLGVTTGTRVEVTAIVQNSGVYVTYITTGTDFTVPDTYSVQLVYQGTGYNLGSVFCNKQVVVQARE
jgi:hypothetical protein